MSFLLIFFFVPFCYDSPNMSYAKLRWMERDFLKCLNRHFKGQIEMKSFQLYEVDGGKKKNQSEVCLEIAFTVILKEEPSSFQEESEEWVELWTVVGVWREEHTVFLSSGFILNTSLPHCLCLSVISRSTSLTLMMRITSLIRMSFCTKLGRYGTLAPVLQIRLCLPPAITKVSPTVSLCLWLYSLPLSSACFSFSFSFCFSLSPFCICCIFFTLSTYVFLLMN